jgi:NAD-reducing hydrogenase small subunit
MKLKFATVWLDGCSGCHMSFLDMDEKLLELNEKVEVVCSPYVDAKEFPEGVDLVLVEGAVSSEEDIEKLKKIRKRAKKIIAFGDCAVTGNVTAMRNICGLEDAMELAYKENANITSDTLNEVVHIDYFLPGCPPPAVAIEEMLFAIIEGREPNINHLTRFGK